MENANDHPFKVSIVKDAEFFANSHPYKVSIEGGGGNEGRVVDELPEEGEPGYIYLVLKESTPEGDIYDEYMWVLQQDGETYGWEHIGATNEVKTGAMGLLTSADLNWNTSTRSATEPYDAIALWLLDDGVYTTKDSSLTICPVQNHIMGNTVNDVFIVTKDGGTNTTRGNVVVLQSNTSYQYGAITGGVAGFSHTIYNPTIEQSMGNSTTSVMSQKAVTDVVGQIETILQTLTTGTGV